MRNRQSRHCLLVRAQVLNQTFNTAQSQRATLYHYRSLSDLITINISLFLWRVHEACTPVINRPVPGAFSGLVDGVAAVSNGCWSARFIHQDDQLFSSFIDARVSVPCSRQGQITQSLEVWCFFAVACHLYSVVRQWPRLHTASGVIWHTRMRWLLCVV